MDGRFCVGASFVGAGAGFDGGLNIVGGVLGVGDAPVGGASVGDLGVGGLGVGGLNIDTGASVGAAGTLILAPCKSRRPQKNSSSGRSSNLRASSSFGDETAAAWPIKASKRVNTSIPLLKSFMVLS